MDFHPNKFSCMWGRRDYIDTLTLEANMMQGILILRDLLLEEEYGVFDGKILPRGDVSMSRDPYLM